MTQTEKARTFVRLHEGPDPLVLPNPWDAGSARTLQNLGFKALTTTSFGLAVSLGRTDGTRSVSRAEALTNAKAIAEAVDLPVAADMENGYGDDPATVAHTIALAAGAGLVGASIEDATGEPSRPIYDLDVAAERIAAAASAARALPFAFTRVARAENFLHGIDDLDDTIRRLQAFEKAGADVLYAPLLPDAHAVARVCRSLSKPVNVLAYGSILAMSVRELGALGVRRISVGSGLFRVAERAFTQAARLIQETGGFDALK